MTWTMRSFVDLVAGRNEDQQYVVRERTLAPACEIAPSRSRVVSEERSAERTLRASLARLAIALLLLAVPACSDEKPKKMPLGVDPRVDPAARSAGYRDTVGSLTYYQGLAPMRVRGYGLVVGLGKNGSSDCPKPVYDKLVQTLYKHHQFSSEVVGDRGVTPEKMIEDLDTAVVLVQGEIPPAAVKGSRFDIAVMALPGTQTKSLRGGRLYTAELEIFRQVSAGAAITGQTLAIAAGPLFLNPFADDESATRSNPLEGTILGGGIVTQARRVRLVLIEPSYQRAQQIQERINVFAGRGERIADAISPSFVQLHIPKEHAEDPDHFLSLVRSLYLTSDPQFTAVRLRELAEEMLNPAANHALLAYCFEGMGRPAIVVLNELYTHKRETISFHAAVAGERLGDHLAIDTLAMHATKTQGSFRFAAIRALGSAKGMAGAAICLRRLLDDEDPRVQTAAYEALLRLGDRSIESISVGRDNLVLDVIPTERPAFVYAKRSRARRIALFGNDWRLRPPILYRAPDGALTISANTGDEHLTLLRVVVASGRSSPPLVGPLDLPQLVEMLGSPADATLEEKRQGLAMDHGAVVRALHSLCESGSLRAQFVLEEPNASELFGTARPSGRPESDF